MLSIFFFLLKGITNHFLQLRFTVQNYLVFFLYHLVLIFICWSVCTHSILLHPFSLPEHVFAGVSGLSSDSFCHGFSERNYLSLSPFKIQQVSIDCSRFFSCFRPIISPPKKVDISKEMRAG